VALLPEDLGERAMLGDAGANALGALLGAAAAGSLSRRARIAILAGVTALTAASEVVSFTKVIQRTPPLHWLDMLGRRPAHAAGSATPATPAGPVGPVGPATSDASGASTVAPATPAAPTTPATPGTSATPDVSVPTQRGPYVTSHEAPGHNARAAPPSP